MPWLPKNAERTSIALTRTAKQWGNKKGGNKMLDKILSEQYRIRYSPAVRQPSFNRHRRCILSSFGGLLVAHAHLKDLAQPKLRKNSAHHFVHLCNNSSHTYHVGS